MLLGSGSWIKHAIVFLHCSKIFSKSCLICFCSSSVITLLLSGAAQFGLRWKTVRCATSFAIVCIVWIAHAPVPIIPTRFPEKSTSSWGHLAVWYAGPLKVSLPSMFGRVNADNGPNAVIKKRATYSSFVFVLTVHKLFCWSKTHASTLLSNLISRRKSNLSAT